MIRLLTIVTLTGSLFLSSLYAMADWQLQQEADGIQVFTKAVPDSDFDAFKAETVIDTDLTTLMAVHFDVNSVKDWMKNCDASRLLSDSISQEGYTAYFKTDSPWPVDDRDYTLTYSIEQNPDDMSVTLSFKTISDLVPETKGTVRVTELEGFWKMTPLNSDNSGSSPKVKIIYQVSANPGGSIPAWIANSFAVDQPFESLKNLRQVVKMEKYQGQTISFIQDPVKP